MRVVPLKHCIVIAPLVSAGDEETQFENEREREEWEQEQKVRTCVRVIKYALHCSREYTMSSQCGRCGLGTVALCAKRLSCRH